MLILPVIRRIFDTLGDIFSYSALFDLHIIFSRKPKAGLYTVEMRLEMLFSYRSICTRMTNEIAFLLRIILICCFMSNNGVQMFMQDKKTFSKVTRPY